MATPTTLAFDYGEDWAVDGTAVANDGVTPINLTGATVTIQIRNVAAILLASGTVTAILTVPLQGQYTLIVGHALTTGITPGVYSFTIRATLSSGSVIDLNTGTITVLANAFS